MEDHEENDCPHCDRPIKDLNKLNKKRHIVSCLQRKNKRLKSVTPPQQGIKKFFISQVYILMIFFLSLIIY